MRTKYAMAMKHKPAGAVPSDWLDRLAAIAGVEVEGHTARGAQFTASPEAFAAVQSTFSADFNIEEVSPRGAT